MIAEAEQVMKWYKEDRFLVMSKEMKYKDSLEVVGALLGQAGVVWGGIRFLIQPDWPFHERQEKSRADRLTAVCPWLNAYEAAGYGGSEETGSAQIFTNLAEAGGPLREPAFEEMVSFMGKLTNARCPGKIAVGLEGLRAADSVKTAEPACFSDDVTDYPGSRFDNMAVICRNAGTAFFRVVLRLEVDGRGRLPEPFSRLEQLFFEQMGTLTDSRYAEAYAGEEREEVKRRELRVREKLEQLRLELEQLALPNKFSRNLNATRKGCSVKQAFNSAFKGTGFKFLDARNFCFKAQMKSGHGYIYRLSIDFGGHIWHRHTFILEVSGINFCRQLLRVDGLSPQSQEECRMNLENLRVQTLFLAERAEALLLEEYGETPEWYECYHKYN